MNQRVHQGCEPCRPWQTALAKVQGSATRRGEGEVRTAWFSLRTAAIASLFTALAIALMTMATVGVFSITAAAETDRGFRTLWFEIQVIDAETGRGVPLVELRTTDGDLYVTDSAGRVALLDLSLMGQRVYFHVSSHGYDLPADGFGYKGKAIDIEPGGKAVIEIQRMNIAERLYRVTGRGIYRDSVLLGYDVPLRQPLINSQVAGQDSVQAVVHNGRIYWFWGDTDRVSYPLGNFRTTGAVSELPQNGGLDPSLGVDLHYFTDPSTGFVRSMAPQPSAAGNLMWIDRLISVPDADGVQRLVARYFQQAGLDKNVGNGLLVFNEELGMFEILRQDLDLREPWQTTRGHGTATHYHDPETGEPYWLFARPWPVIRVADSFEAVQQPEAYESFTPLQPGTSFRGADTLIERNAAGEVVWDWKPNTEPISQQQEKMLIEFGLLRPEEARFQLRDVDSGDEVVIHGASVRWNEYRQKWIMIGNQVGGRSSYLGEVWYAEADSPTGPWRWAKRIATHDGYSFYNPTQHAFFDQEGGRYIYFEGTYTNQFTGGTPPTPLYDYNQIMYRLDLADPRLTLPDGP